ncbi:hypothetical protein U91I_02747 [alpha proteobacterium U9-1i]|nr:hypothetical protein U91I_02747 [alpha proteobacterium U9-1i]
MGFSALRLFWDFVRNGHQPLDVPESEHSGPMRFRTRDGGERVTMVSVPSDDVVDTYLRR